MAVACGDSLRSYLTQVVDPRGRKGRRHSLSAMLTAVICGLLCGNRGYTSLVEWLHDLPVDVWHWMGYTRRPPKKDCFRDLLMRLDPEVLEDVLKTWIENVLELDPDLESEDEVRAISLDGKTLCGTLKPFSRAVHLLSAVDQQTGFVLSQCRVDEKTNEHKAALSLLRTLILEDRVVVGDAMFCQRDLSEQIIDSGGDYLFAVKENQPQLYHEIQVELAASEAAFFPLGQA